jgi:hypothetical protein
MLIITKEDSYRAGALVRVLRETEARYYVEPVRNAAGRRTPGGGSLHGTKARGGLYVAKDSVLLFDATEADYEKYDALYQHKELQLKAAYDAYLNARHQIDAAYQKGIKDIKSTTG